MKPILVIALITPLILAFGYTEQPCTATQDSFKQKCVNSSCFNTYVPHLVVSTKDGAISIDFSGSVEYLADTGDVKVTVQFTDQQNDGLANRDNNLSCLDSKLIRYNTVKYEDGQVYTNTIISTYVGQNRQWSWTIKGADLKAVLIEDSSDPNFITLFGFFGLQFSVVDEVQLTYYMDFSLKLSSDMRKTIEISYEGHVETNKSACNSSGECISKADSSIAFCNTPDDCTTTTQTKDLYLNQKIGVIQKITTPGFETHYLRTTGVTFTGAGLSRKITNFSQVQTAGQVVVTIPVEFVYSSVSITLQSELSATILEKRVIRKIMINDITGSMVFASTVTTTQSTNCIKTSETATQCPTCDEQKANGAVTPDCKSSSMLSVLAILVVLVSLI